MESQHLWFSPAAMNTPPIAELSKGNPMDLCNAVPLLPESAAGLPTPGLQLSTVVRPIQVSGSGQVPSTHGSPTTGRPS